MSNKEKLEKIDLIIQEINENYYGKFDFYKSYIGRKILEIGEILEEEDDN